MESAESSAAVKLSMPTSLSPAWTQSTDKLADWVPSFQNPSDQLTATYKNGGSAVGVYLAYYRHQDYNRKLVSSENVWVKSKDAVWAQVASGNRTIDWAGTPLQVRTGELRGAPLTGLSGEARLAIWQIYWVNGTLTASDALAKAYGAVYRLMGRGDDSAAIILYAPKGVAGEGEASLSAFVQANAGAIDALLQRASADR
jgi:EpsI family protein